MKFIIISLLPTFITLSLSFHLCSRKAVICVGTLHNSSDVDGSGCVGTETCHVVLSIVPDSDEEKFIFKVDHNPDNLWTLIGFSQDGQVKRYLHFAPREEGAISVSKNSHSLLQTGKSRTVNEWRSDRVAKYSLGWDIVRNFTVKISAWSPQENDGKDVMVENAQVELEGVTNDQLELYPFFNPKETSDHH